MKVTDHPVYFDCARFMSSHGKRQLRRQLRVADKMIIQAAKKRGVWIPVNVRIAMVYESELDAQSRRHQCLDALVVAKSGDGKLVFSVPNQV